MNLTAKSNITLRGRLVRLPRVRCATIDRPQHHQTRWRGACSEPATVRAEVHRQHPAALGDERQRALESVLERQLARRPSIVQLEAGDGVGERAATSTVHVEILPRHRQQPLGFGSAGLSDAGAPQGHNYEQDRDEHHERRRHRGAVPPFATSGVAGHRGGKGLLDSR